MGSSPKAAPAAAPVYTDPVNGMSFSDSNALNEEIKARKVDEQNASNVSNQKALDAAQVAKQQALDQDQQDEAAFGSRLNTARNTTRDSIKEHFRQQGYDPELFNPQIENTINTQAQGVADKAATPIASFDQNSGANLVSQLVSGKRAQATQAINKAFSPTYANDMISDSWLQDASAPILSTQFDPLSSQLENASKRGTLNDTGYQAALKALSDKQTSAKSTLNSLGSNILSTDRTGVNDYITGAKNDAAALDLSNADSFSPDTYLKGAGQLSDKYHQSFAGDLSNAVGSTSFADLGSLMNAGGAVQGATDPNVTSGKAGAGGDVSDAYIAQQALAQQKRGLGSGSSF